MKLNKKIMLSAFAGASAIGAITPALVTSVNANKLNIPNHVCQSEDDLRFGLDDSTYLEVKQNLAEAREKQLLDKGYQKDSKAWKQEMSLVQNTLTTFDNISKTQNCSYTQLTTAVVNYARSEYKIPLIRTTNAKWNDITDMFNGTLKSVTLYMDHEHLPSQMQKMVIANATAKFNATLTELERQNYKECDPYGAMIEVRKEMLSFFDVLNAQVAKLSASIKLSTFIQKYKIVPKENGKNYSELKDLVVGQPIANINDILTFVNPETGVETTFVSDRMVPGYTITPKLAGFTVDKEKNHYGINIDWAATANHYVNTNEALDAEGHIYDIKESTFKTLIKSELPVINPNTKLMDQLGKILNKIKVLPQSYAIKETKTGMNTNILAAYFGENGLTFEWPTGMDVNAKLEPFYNQIDEATKQGVATMLDLADAGLKVSETINGEKVTRYLSEVIKTAQTKKDTNTFTLAEKFVANCNVYSLTKIGNAVALVNANGQVNEKNTVQNTFYVTYANTVNHKLNTGNKGAIKTFVANSIAEDWVILPENKQPGACVDYVTSEQYFFNLCQKYTGVKDAVDFLSSIDEKLDEAISRWNEIRSWQYFHMSTAGVNFITFAFFMFFIMQANVYESDRETKQSAINSQFAAALAAVIGAIGSAVHFIIAFMAKDVIDDIIFVLKNIRNVYQKEVSEKGLKPILEKLQTRIAKDSDTLTLIRTQPKKDPVIVDKADYDKKLQQYYQNPFEAYKSMLNFYGNFEWEKAGLGTAEINILSEFTNKFNEIFINLNKWLVGTSRTNDQEQPGANSKTTDVINLTKGEYVLLGIEIVCLILDSIFMLPHKGDWTEPKVGEPDAWLMHWNELMASIVPSMLGICSGVIQAYIAVAFGISVFANDMSFMKHFNAKIQTEESLPENIDLK